MKGNDTVPDRSVDQKSEVTVEFDHHDPAIAANPFPAYEEVRSKCPVSWTNAHDGFWMFLNYETIFETARNNEVFRSSPTVGIPWYGLPPNIPLETDAPMTPKYRELVQREVSPGRAKAMEPDIARAVDEFIDEFIERGEADLMSELLVPVTAQAILRLLGFPVESWQDMAGFVHTIVHDLKTDPEAAMTAGFNMIGAIQNMMKVRREDPRDDIVTRLVHAKIDDRPITDEEVQGYLQTLILGGLDTTSGAAGNALVRMTKQPGIRERLIAEPELRRDAVEEFLRVDAPTIATARYVDTDTEVDGFRLCAGERVLLAWAVGNRDPELYDDPDQFKFGRTNTKHMTFGVGLHRCLGSNLARMTLRMLLNGVLDRLPDYELTANDKDCRFEDSGVVYACTSVPVKFTPGRRRLG